MIRPAVPADAPAIAAIWNPMIRDTLVTFDSVEKTEAEIAALGYREVATVPEVGRKFDRWLDLVPMVKLLGGSPGGLR